MLCKVCGELSNPFGTALVLKKYTVTYYRCGNCGFIQSEEPYWLAEAYSSAIASLDVGIMQRNLENAEVTACMLSLLFPEVKLALDFGGGHGIFVRLMRDRGFPFHWHDVHASNDYARGFEYEPSLKYEFATAFEVLEHLPAPVGELSQLMARSANVFVSTLLLPEPAPAPAEWWYYALQTGQHISFYTLNSLQLIAAHFGRRLLSHGVYHLFTTEPLSAFTYRLATRVRTARLVNRFRKRASLIESDFQQQGGKGPIGGS
jgi:hypothetical protein